MLLSQHKNKHRNNATIARTNVATLTGHMDTTYQMSVCRNKKKMIEHTLANLVNVKHNNTDV